MKYVCQICGYIYDDEKEGIKFEDLPEFWTCPLCGADKSAFILQKEQKVESIVQVESNHEELQELSIGELSSLCSNLARGCEKQYLLEEAKLYHQLADYFHSITPKAEMPSTAELLKLIQTNLDQDYPNAVATATFHQDRGTLRALIWGEKVTRILKSLLERYEKNGESFLEGTQVWVCSACGFVYVGDQAPALCPVCKVPDWKFEKIGGKGL